MATFGSALEWCSATVIRFIRVDVVTPEQYSYHSLVPIPSSTLEWCSTVVVWLVRGDIVPFE